jgi:hypothetical protein
LIAAVLAGVVAAVSAVGCIASTSHFVDRERRSGGLELVRLTPQSPLAVLAAWTVGSWLPLGSSNLALGVAVLVGSGRHEYAALLLHAVATLLMLCLAAAVVALRDGLLGPFLLWAAPVGAVSMAAAFLGPVGLVVPPLLAAGIAVLGQQRIARG